MKAPTMLPGAEVSLEKPLFKIASFAQDNITIASGERPDLYPTVSDPPSGYTIYVIKRIAAYNATNSGTNAQYMRIINFGIENSQVRIKYYNQGSSSAKVRIEGEAIYVRSDLI